MDYGRLNQVLRFAAEPVGHLNALLHLMATDPSHREPNANTRLIAADALEEEGRRQEAAALRSGDELHLRPYPYHEPTTHTIHRVVNGTSYHAATPDKVIELIEEARRSGTRLHISYGDPETGRDELSEFENRGTVGRSTGTQKIPLMIATSRSMGGGPIDTERIVRIRLAPSGHVWWQHPNYHHGEVAIRKLAHPMAESHTHSVDVDGQPHAYFRGEDKARQWVKKMGLTLTESGEPK